MGNNYLKSITTSWQSPQCQNNRSDLELGLCVSLKEIHHVGFIKKTVLVLCTSALLFGSGLSLASQGTWRFAGSDIHNTANSETETEITPANVGQLVTKFIHTTAPDGQVGDVKVPTVLGNRVYFSDMSGNLTALDNRTNTVIWKKNFVTDYSPLLHGMDSNIPVGATVKYGWNSPSIMGNLLIIGSGGPQSVDSNLMNAIHEEGAVVMAINRHTGALVWARQIDNHPTAIITQSAAGKGDAVYMGVSSTENAIVGLGFGTDANPVSLPLTGGVYKCCTFRGSMVALNKNTGEILWKFYTVPTTEAEKNWRNRPTGAGLSWSGNSVWGSTPVIDQTRGLLYFGTGQTHTIPNSVAAAQNLSYDPTGSNFVQLTANAYPSSIPAGNYPSSLIALKLNDGTVQWSKSFGKLRGFDAWTNACVSYLAVFGLPFDYSSISYCPSNVLYSATDPLLNLFLSDHPFDFFVSSILSGGFSPIAPNGDFANLPVPFPSGTSTWDHDFGQGPMLVKNVTMPNGSKRDLLIAAQKSGVTRALDPGTGDVLWQTFEGTGGLTGGHSFGSATDGKRVYLTNNKDLTYSVLPVGGVTLKDGSNAGGEAYFSALDIATGNILWETKAPFGAGVADVLSGAVSPGELTTMVSVANGVVYGVVGEDNATLVALDAATGQILLEHPTANAAAGQPGGFRAQRAIVVNGVVYVGTGSTQSHGHPGNKLILLTLPNHQTNSADNSSDDNNDNNINGDTQ